MRYTLDERLPEPYAAVPSDATEAEIAAHKDNYQSALAREAATLKSGQDPSGHTAHVAGKVATYLVSHFDPRPLDEICLDFTELDYLQRNTLEPQSSLS